MNLTLDNYTAQIIAEMQFLSSGQILWVEHFHVPWLKEAYSYYVFQNIISRWWWWLWAVMRFVAVRRWVNPTPVNLLQMWLLGSRTMIFYFFYFASGKTKWWKRYNLNNPGNLNAQYYVVLCITLLAEI